MPQKTKAQKIAADLKRRGDLVGKINYTPTFLNTLHGSSPLTVEDTYKKEIGKPKSKQTYSANINNNDYGYVTSDLKRVAIFSLVAFGAEVALWYFLMVRS